MISVNFHRCECALDIENPFIPVLIQPEICSDSESGHNLPGSAFFSDRGILSWEYIVNCDGELRVLRRINTHGIAEVKWENDFAKDFVEPYAKSLLGHIQAFRNSPNGKLYPDKLGGPLPDEHDTLSLIREMRKYACEYPVPEGLAPVFSDALQDIFSALPDPYDPPIGLYQSGSAPFIFPITPTQMG